MICPSCKFENIEGADECSNCGQALYGLDLPDAGVKNNSPAFIHEALEALPQRPVVTVQTSDPVALAVRRMQTDNASAIFVLDGSRMAGIITTWDVLHKVAGRADDLNAVTCSQIMTPNPVTFEADDSLATAINRMSSGEFRHIPIVRDGQTVSVLDVNDIFRHISPHLV